MLDLQKGNGKNAERERESIYIYILYLHMLNLYCNIYSELDNKFRYVAGDVAWGFRGAQATCFGHFVFNSGSHDDANTQSNSRLHGSVGHV